MAYHFSDSSLMYIYIAIMQCCGAGAAWSCHFLGGSRAGADFFGRSREPEPHFLRRLRNTGYMTSSAECTYISWGWAVWAGLCIKIAIDGLV